MLAGVPWFDQGARSFVPMWHRSGTASGVSNPPSSAAPEPRAAPASGRAWRGPTICHGQTRYYEDATTSRIRIPDRLCCSLPGSMPSLVHFLSRLRAPAGPEGFRQARGFVQPASQRRCLCKHGRIQDLIGSQAIRSIPLPRLLTPAGSERPRLGGRFDAAPAHRATKAPAFDDFVAIIPWLQYLLPTLHECRCLTHARLASGWLARLCREGIQPSGSPRKVSVRFTSASAFPELAYRGLRASASNNSFRHVPPTRRDQATAARSSAPPAPTT